MTQLLFIHRLRTIENRGRVETEKLEELIDYLSYRISNTDGHKHHILPKSWFPEYIKDTNNLIELLPEEHLYAHKLYKLAFPEDPAMFFAFDRMIKSGKLFGYDVSEEELNLHFSEYAVMNSGENNSFYGKHHSPETIAKILNTRGKITSANKGKVLVFNPKTSECKFISLTDLLPDGFRFGSNPEIYTNRKKRKYDELVELRRSLSIRETFSKIKDDNNGLLPWIKTGAESPSYGGKRYFNPTTSENILIFDDRVPDGFEPGIFIDPIVLAQSSVKKSIAMKGRVNVWNQITNRNPDKIRKTAEKHTGMKRSDEAKTNIKNAVRESFANGRVSHNKDTIQIYSILTLEVKTINKIDAIPDGWIRGNPKAKNMKMYHNPCTEENKRFLESEVPSGWIIGFHPLDKHVWCINTTTNERKKIKPRYITTEWIRVH